MALVASLIMLLLLSILLSVHGGFSLGTRFSKLLVKSCLLSLPLALVLFVVIPRLPSLWKMPQQKQATTGLSDQVTPGDIAELSRSSELAVRAAFANEPVAEQDRYWRVMTLDYFDGKSWTMATKVNNNGLVHTRNRQQDVVSNRDHWLTYQVYAEPSYQHWLYALDVATTTDEGIIQLPEFNLYAKKPVTKVKRYAVRSNLSMKLVLELPAKRRQLNLALPLNANPKLAQEGKRLRALYQEDEKIIEHVLTTFRQQAFFYTLQPPLLQNNSLDEFYFETRAGFCEYYASSFAYLMRAAGIPTRLVLGYMGGEYNPNGDYYSVYQRDAHAWTEVWLAGKGWQRVDPTAAVSPERVESGFSDQLWSEQAQFSARFFNSKTLASFAFINELRLQFAALDHQWTRWVVGYSAKQQLNIMSRWFDNFKPWKSAVVIALAITAMMLCLWLINIYQQSKKIFKKSQHLEIYQKSLALLAKQNIKREPAMSPLAFAQQVNDKIHKKAPNAAANFQRITATFIRLEYQQSAKDDERKNLEGVSEKLTSQLKEEYKRFKQALRYL